MKKTLNLVLIMLCLACCLSVNALAADNSEGSLDNFIDRYEYTEGRFVDISDGFWYGKYVAKAYVLGLVKGQSDELFGPEGNITIAETIALAARLHSTYFTGEAEFTQSGSWYQVYVDYCREMGILSGEEFQLDAEATRRQFAHILCGSLPAGALIAINDIPDGIIPDVAAADESAAEIYRLYRAGVLTGNDELGTFEPDTPIARSAVSAIVTRMAVQNMRVSFSLGGYRGPDLSEREAMDDEFFSDAAILGNSLVEGIRIYAKLNTMTYYSGTSMTVLSAMNTRDVLLNNGTYGTQLDAMAQYDYGKVYIELGINDIGYPVETFIANYGAMIDRIKADQPEADIYIMAITPVAKSREATSTVFKKDRVEQYNAALYQLAAEKECYYLDCYTILQGPDGYLPEEHTWDGVHLNVPQYTTWENFIRTHYAY